MRAVPIVCGLALLACSSRIDPPPPTESWTPPPRVAPPGTAPAPRARTPRSLAANEGSLEIAPARAPVGAAATARVRVVPGAGFHINTAYPFVVSLADGAGVTIAKSRLTGGRDGERGDAETLTEQELSIPIALSPTTTGQHALHGTLDFGICTDNQCLARSIPVVIEITGCDAKSTC